MNNNYPGRVDLRIPDEEFYLRVDNIKKRMKKESIDLMILVGDEHYQGHVRYVSDYRPMLEYAIVVIGRDKDPILLCGPECKVLAYHTSRIKEIRVCSDMAIPGEEYPNEEMFTLKEILSEMEGKNSSKRVGIVSLDIVPKFLIKPIYEVCEGKEILNSSNILDELRGIKSDNEISIMKRAYEMGIAGIEKGRECLNVGKSETEILAEMAYPIYKMGAEQMSHAFYAASGAGTSPALYFSNSCKIINDGDLVILDIGAVYNGYYSDVGTTTIVGKKSKEKLKVLDTAKKALAAAMSKIKPGIMGKEIDLAARKITTEAGFGKNHVYGSCHGVGLQHCEYPFFGPNTDIEVEEGMFFNVDLGLFNFDFGGVRLENGILVTVDGYEVFDVEHHF